MKTERELLEIVKLVSYKPGWGIKFGTLPDLYVQVVCHLEREPWSGRKWRISQHMTKSEIVATCFKAVLSAEEHECREQFTYKGVAVYGPHIDVEKLLEVAGHYDVRQDAMAGA